MGVVIGSAVAPISMAIFWARVTAPAMIGGAVGGTTCGLIAWLITASTYEGGLGDFMINTGREVPMLVGNLVSMSLGASVTIIISLVTNRNFTAGNNLTLDSVLPEKQKYWKRGRPAGVLDCFIQNHHFLVLFILICHALAFCITCQKYIHFQKNLRKYGRWRGT